MGGRASVGGGATRPGSEEKGAASEGATGTPHYYSLEINNSIQRAGYSGLAYNTIVHHREYMTNTYRHTTQTDRGIYVP